MAVNHDELPAPGLREADGPPEPPVGRRRHGLQRVQIGLAGLAAMVLLVGLASIIISNARQNQAQVVPEAAPTVQPTPTPTQVSDPLADVGVVPDLPAEAIRQPPAPLITDVPPPPAE